MIEKFLKNVNNRRVLIEKYPYFFKKNYFGMEVFFPKSNKKSELIVQFKIKDDFFPDVKGSFLIDEYGNIIVNFRPLDIKIFSFIDCYSFEFIEWVNSFKDKKQNYGGIEISFFTYCNNNKKIITSLTGCVIENISYSEISPCISVEFFTYKNHPQ